jgi:scyllo-inositol 2-dehydrogenase (NADP+)
MVEGSLKVGVVGAGWVATARHIPCFQRIPGVEVVAVLDHSLSRARDAATRHKIARAFDDPEEFYATGLDIVAICTPPQTHAAVAIDALDRGSHVFIEKPMAMSEDEAQDMIRAADRNERLLCVSHNLLFSRSMQKIKKMAALGELGEVRQVVGFQLSSPTRRLPVWYSELPGGLFFDEAAHLLYLMRYFLGDSRLEVASVRRDSEGDAVASVLAKFQGEAAEGILSMSFEAPVSEWTLTVVGSRRVVIFDIFRDILTCLRPDGTHAGKDILRNTVLAGADFASGFVTSGVLHSTKRLFYGHERLIDRFVESVRAGGQAPISGTDGLYVVSTIERLLRSKSGAFLEAA